MEGDIREELEKHRLEEELNRKNIEDSKLSYIFDSAVTNILKIKKDEDGVYRKKDFNEEEKLNENDYENER